VSIHIWIDADSCPRMVRDYLVRYTSRLSIPLFLVANRVIPLPRKSSCLSMIICNETPDAADKYIISHAKQQDLVVTRDIPFAARLVTLNITVINDRGTVYTNENIKERLSERDFSLQLTRIGLTENHTAPSYSKKHFSAFANCFDKEIHRLLKSQPEAVLTTKFKS
jgi:uncharacterized protein